jgi:protein-tyrosine phosphatase
LIDLHTHILPGIDDGSATEDGAVKFAWAAVAAGTTELVATPHVTWDIPNTSDTVHEGVAALERRLHDERIPLRLRTGAEVAITRAADLPDDELTLLHLGGGEWLLAECPLTVAATGFEHVLFHLQSRGHRILLGHPERSPPIQREPALLQQLIGAGMLTSVTAGSLVGAFGPTVREFTFEMVSAGLVHNVASDAHDPVRRPPGMRGPIEAADAELPGLAEQADWLCGEVPRAILDGGHIPPRPGPAPEPRRHGLIGRLARRR